MTVLRHYRRFMVLSPEKRALVPRAWATVAIVRLSLLLLHPAYVLRKVEAAVHERRLEKHRVKHSRPVETIAWAVRSCSRRIPGATCLTQALAGRLLLAADGYDSDLRIGVARSESGDLQAHAWLVVGGAIVIGGGDTHRYSTFPDLSESLPTVMKRAKSSSAT